MSLVGFVAVAKICVANKSFNVVAVLGPPVVTKKGRLAEWQEKDIEVAMENEEIPSLKPTVRTRKSWFQMGICLLFQRSIFRCELLVLGRVYSPSKNHGTGRRSFPFEMLPF